nr:palindromic element RPE4 domain-containing protein [Rickettsia tillamookensis]
MSTGSRNTIYAMSTFLLDPVDKPRDDTEVLS